MAGLHQMPKRLLSKIVERLTAERETTMMSSFWQKKSLDVNQLGSTLCWPATSRHPIWGLQTPELVELVLGEVSGANLGQFLCCSESLFHHWPLTIGMFHLTRSSCGKKSSSNCFIPSTWSKLLSLKSDVKPTKDPKVNKVFPDHQRNHILSDHQWNI